MTASVDGWDEPVLGEIEALQESWREDERLLPLINIPAWSGMPPEREFAWGQHLPLRQVTLLTGRGGIGKSLLAQQLVSYIALGRSFLGKDTRPMPALYQTVEDDPDEIWRRQAAICSSLDMDLRDQATRETLASRLTLASLSGKPLTALGEFDHDGKLKPTELFAELRVTVRERGIRMIAIDNATDAMAGDHNDIHEVAAFVNLLTGLAIEMNGAVLLLHHPNKGGDDWLGSVAWHNKVRSRLLLKSAEREGDADQRVLTNPKANYTAEGGSIEMRWHRGAFVCDQDLPTNVLDEIQAAGRAAGDNDLFLACLRQRNKERRAVSERPSPTYAPTVFADMPESKGIGRRRLGAAMSRLFRLELIERAELWVSDDRKRIFGLREVE